MNRGITRNNHSEGTIPRLLVIALSLTRVVHFKEEK
tara:strand:+ start:659 stop:766 length:108 start_codon:yes stop_codon:yes gene_type:complete